MRGGFGNKEGGEMAIGVGGACHHADQRVRGEDIRVVMWRDRGGGVGRGRVDGARGFEDGCISRDRF